MSIGTIALQQDIIKHGGYIFSDGTLNMNHLLPKAYDLIHNHRMEETSDKAKTILAGILDCFKPDSEDMIQINAHGLYFAQYYNMVKLSHEMEINEATSWLWNEDIYNLFQEIAPSNFSFGSSEGDGACIGWFKDQINCDNCGKCIDDEPTTHEYSNFCATCAEELELHSEEEAEEEAEEVIPSFTYQNILFWQGDEAYKVLDTIENFSQQQAIEYLMQWDMGECEVVTASALPYGKGDTIYQWEDYIMSYNIGLGHVGLIKVEGNEGNE